MNTSTATSRNQLAAQPNIGLLLAAFGLIVGLLWAPAAYVLTALGLAMAWPALADSWQAPGGRGMMVKNACIALALFAAPAVIAIIQHRAA